MKKSMNDKIKKAKGTYGTFDCIFTKCDVCKKKLNDNEHDWTVLSEYWGYFSNKDQEYDECVVCSDCFDKIVEYIETLGGKVRRYIYGITTGSILGTKEGYLKKIRKENAKHKNK